MCKIPSLETCTCSPPLSTKIIKRARFPFDPTFQNLSLVWDDQMFLEMIYKEHGKHEIEREKKHANVDVADSTD